jgi:hypothetical protein
MSQPTEQTRVSPGDRGEGGSRLGLSGYNTQRLAIHHSVFCVWIVSHLLHINDNLS